MKKFSDINKWDFDDWQGRLVWIFSRSWARYIIYLIMILGAWFGLNWLDLAFSGEVEVPFSTPALVIPVLGIDLVFKYYTVAVVLGLGAAALVVVLLQVFYVPLRELDLGEVLLFALIPGIISARLYYLVTTPSILQANPLAWLDFASGGLSIIGGIFGGMLGMWVYARWRLHSFKLILSAAATALPLAQVIGRWGNFFNYELLGLPAQLPWSMFVDSVFRPFGYQGYDLFQPLFLYESIANFLLFLVLIFIWKKNWRDSEKLKSLINSGFFIKVYLITYLSVRFLLDFIRIDGSQRYYDFTVTQLTIIGLFFFIIIYGVYFQLRFRKDNGTWFTSHKQLK